MAWALVKGEETKTYFDSINLQNCFFNRIQLLHRNCSIHQFHDTIKLNTCQIHVNKFSSYIKSDTNSIFKHKFGIKIIMEFLTTKKLTMGNQHLIILGSWE